MLYLALAAVAAVPGAPNQKNGTVHAVAQVGYALIWYVTSFRLQKSQSRRILEDVPTV